MCMQPYLDGGGLPRIAPRVARRVVAKDDEMWKTIWRWDTFHVGCILRFASVRMPG